MSLFESDEKLENVHDHASAQIHLGLVVDSSSPVSVAIYSTRALKD
jgi:hypothetical protein